MKQPIISRSPEIMGGSAVFHGTRVPVQTLLDYLEAGESIDDFLGGFPSVTREHVIAFLEEAKTRMVEAASSKFWSTNASIGGSPAISPDTA
jgi:uncharacterized protein (DUF433 family)